MLPCFYYQTSPGLDCAVVCFSVRKRGGWRPKKVLIWSELRCSGRGPPPGCQAVAGVTPAQWP
eukprot:scaffold96830_cov19-Tisochrysis_lutea.AAC.1